MNTRKPGLRALAGVSSLVIAGLVLGCGEKSRTDLGYRAESSPEPTTTTRAPDPLPEPVPSPVATPEVVIPVPLPPVTYAEAEGVFRERRYPEAAELFSRYVEQRPENPWGHYMLGLSAWKAGQLSTAEAAFSRSLDLDPEHGKSLLNLTRVLLESGRLEDARACADRAVELDPQSGTAHRLRGRVHGEMGDAGGAEEAYRTAIGLDPDDVWSLNNLGLLHIQQGRFEDALPPLARAAELRPKLAVVQNNLGVTLERLGYLPEAASAFRAAVGSESGHDRAEVSLARVESLAASTEPPTLDLSGISASFLARIRATGDDDVSGVVSGTDGDSSVVELGQARPDEEPR